MHVFYCLKINLFYFISRCYVYRLQHCILTAQVDGWIESNVRILIYQVISHQTAVQSTAAQEVVRLTGKTWHWGNHCNTEYLQSTMIYVLNFVEESIKSTLGSPLYLFICQPFCKWLANVWPLKLLHSNSKNLALVHT